MDRTHPTRTLNGLKYLFARLKTNGKIVLFPEGTYFKDFVGPGKTRLIQMVLTFQSGARIPILFLPVGIRYEGKGVLEKETNYSDGLTAISTGKIRSAGSDSSGNAGDEPFKPITSGLKISSKA